MTLIVNLVGKSDEFENFLSGKSDEIFPDELKLRHFFPYKMFLKRERVNLGLIFFQKFRFDSLDTEFERISHPRGDIMGGCLEWVRQRVNQNVLGEKTLKTIATRFSLS